MSQTTQTNKQTNSRTIARRPIIQGWLCAAWFTAAMGGAFAAVPKLAAVCAERDIAAITLIEERADSEIVPSENLYRAFSTQMQALTACASGQVGDALALYDRIQNEVRTAGSGTVTR